MVIASNKPATNKVARPKHLDQNLGDELWGHRWGFSDTEFLVDPKTRTVTMTGNRYDISGYPMPYLIPFLEENLGVSIDLNNMRREVVDRPIDPPIRNQGFCQAIADNFSENSYSFDDSVRLRHSHGQTVPTEAMKVLYKRLNRCADMVFFCESEADAEKLIELAIEHDVCLIPFGGGTSVTGALTLPPEETRMIVAINMRRMNKIEWIDTENLKVCVQAGMTGKSLEAELYRAGYTCGHEPDSVELSTVGGWISTNASGMKKNRYGNIEDIVESVTLLTPNGLIEQKFSAPRASVGMQLQKLLFGSEGNLGIITKAVLKLHPVPEARSYGALVFPSFSAGKDFLKVLSQTNYVPASFRLVDNNQFYFGRALQKADTTANKLFKKVQDFFLAKVKGYDPHEFAAATILMEGTKEEVAYQKQNIKKLVRQFGGVYAGETVGKRGYRLTLAIAYLRDFLFQLHTVGNACETTVPWTRVEDVVEAVKKALADCHKEYNLPGKPFLTYRITQVYRTGVCIYFMNGFFCEGMENPEDMQSKIDLAMKDAVVSNGGTLSHHHGVGKVRSCFLNETMSATGLRTLKHVKEMNDPKNIFGIRNNVLNLTEDQFESNH